MGFLDFLGGQGFRIGKLEEEILLLRRRMDFLEAEHMDELEKIQNIGRKLEARWRSRDAKLRAETENEILEQELQKLGTSIAQKGTVDVQEVISYALSNPTLVKKIMKEIT